MILNADVLKLWKSHLLWTKGAEKLRRILKSRSIEATATTSGSALVRIGKAVTLLKSVLIYTELYIR